MKNKIVSLLLLLTIPVTSFALTEQDFAYSADIETQKQTPFYELELPSIVYKTISRDDMGDLRIINGAGQVIPHGIRDGKTKVDHTKQVKNIPFYPLYQNEDKNISDLQLNIKRDASGEVINLQSRPATNDKNKKLSGYLLDLRKWNQPVQQLTINWKKISNPSFIRKLTIERSDDLEKWQTVATGKTLVKMSFKNHHLKENTFDTYIAKSKYLKLSYEDDTTGLELESIQAMYSHASRTKLQSWETVSLQKMPRAGEYQFNHQLKTVVRQLEVKLPENNTVVQVKVLSRMNDQQSWRYRGSSLLYRLSAEGSDIEKTTINVTANQDKKWLLRVDQQGGGLGSGLPVVKYAWQPQQLVFVARGKPPYKIIWGSAKVKPVLVNANHLLPSPVSGPNDTVTGNNKMISSAALQVNTFTTRNADALKPKEKPTNWQTWILWISLVAAALILVWMAMRLMKKMDES